MQRRFLTTAGLKTMHRISAAIIFMVLFIFKADSAVSNRKKHLHDATKEAVNDAVLKSQDKTKDGQERFVRTLNVRRIVDTFTPWNQDGTDKGKRFGPGMGTMKQEQGEDLVPVDKTVEAPMPIYDDDVDETMDPLQGLLPQKYWEQRDDQQQASLINDFFRKNVHNQKTPFFTAGNDANNNNNQLKKLRREFVSVTGNNKNFINNGKPQNDANKLSPVDGNFKKFDGQYHGEENLSPDLLDTYGRNQPMNFKNQYSPALDNRSPLEASANSPPEYNKASFLQTADPLAAGEYGSADSGGNAGTGYVFYSEPRRATDISPLNSDLANGIGKIVDTIMKDVIVNNLRNDQQKVSPSSSSTCNSEAGEVVIASLVEKAIPPLSTRGAPPLESVFSPNIGQTTGQENFASGRKLLFFHNNNKDKKYPMPVKTKANKISFINQSKEAKKDNGNNLHFSLQNDKLQLQSANNKSQLNEPYRFYTNASRPSNNGVYVSGNPSVKDLTKSDKEKLARLKNLHDYQKYLNLMKNMNRGNEEHKNQNKLPSSPLPFASPKTENVTIKQNTNDNSLDKENNLQKIEQVNRLLNIQHREDEKKGNNPLLQKSQPHIEYRIDDYTNKLKQQQDVNHQSAIPADNNNKMNEEQPKYKLEPNQDKNSESALPNAENKLKYPLIQSKSDQVPSPFPENHDKVMPPNSSGGAPQLPVPGNDQNDNELLQQIIKHVNEYPLVQPHNNDAGNAFKMNKPDNDQQPKETVDDNTFKMKIPDNGEQNDQPIPVDTHAAPTGDQQYKTTTTASSNQNDPALMIEEINKFILERKAKLESLSEFIAKLRLKKLEEMSTKGNAIFSKNRRQVNEFDLEKDDKDLLSNNNDDKNSDNGVGFSDDDDDIENRGVHFLTGDQKLNGNVGILGSNNNDVTTTAAVATSSQQTNGQTDKQINAGSQTQNNYTTNGSNQTFAANNVTLQTTAAPITSATGTGKVKPSDMTKRPQLSEEELEAMNINMSNKIVDRIFQQADQTENMRANLGLCRKNESVKSLKASEKILPESEAVLKQVLECIRGLIKYQLQKQTCSVLDKELYEFLKWMLLTGEAKHGTDYLTRRRKHGSVKSDFLFNNECDTTTPCVRTGTGAAADSNSNLNSDGKFSSGLQRIFGK